MPTNKPPTHTYAHARKQCRRCESTGDGEKEAELSHHTNAQYPH